MLTAIVAFAALAIVFGLLLGYSAIRFHVEGDPIVDQIDSILPQTQCGQCGFPGCRPYAEAMVGDLAAVGIKAKLMMMKYSALREKHRAGKVQFNFQTWGSYSINDVSAIVSHFFEFSEDDMARDPQVRDWLLEADSTIDTDKRKMLYKKAFQRIAEQAYWAPLFTYVSNNCFSKDLDFTPYPDAVPRFFQAKWK